MDVKLQNAYVEVLLDNFLSVVKQNVMFQAQLKTLTDASQELANTKKALEDLAEKYRESESRFSDMNNTVNALRVDNSNKESQIVNTTSLQKEKDRLQTAANDLMRQLGQLKDEKNNLLGQIETHKQTSDSTNKYIEKLELMIPATKLKKLKAEEQNDVVKNGGSF